MVNQTWRNLNEKITRLKRELDAVIVAHNYQRPEVQDIADFTGDSLELARKCAEIKSKTIVFCGVRFMAETAAILNPGSTVLLTHPRSGCPLANMIDVSELRQWKRRYPGATVVSYINTTAAVKAESDVCCTSANGVTVVNAMQGDEILFIPDKNLGHYISTKTSKRIILFPGSCYVHDRITTEHIKQAKQLYPEAKVLVHPECRPDVIELADAALSTSQMIYYARQSSERVFLIGTEEGMLHQLKKQNPGKEFHIIAKGSICSDMKKTTLETVVQTMETGKEVVTVPEKTGIRARQAIERMLSIN
jgi:quinolinate synthase